MKTGFKKWKQKIKMQTKHTLSQTLEKALVKFKLICKLDSETL